MIVMIATFMVPIIEKPHQRSIYLNILKYEN